MSYLHDSEEEKDLPFKQSIPPRLYAPGNPETTRKPSGIEHFLMQLIDQRSGKSYAPHEDSPEVEKDIAQARQEVPPEDYWSLSDLIHEKRMGRMQKPAEEPTGPELARGDSSPPATAVSQGPQANSVQELIHELADRRAARDKRIQDSVVYSDVLASRGPGLVPLPKEWTPDLSKGVPVGVDPRKLQAGDLDEELFSPSH